MRYSAARTLRHLAASLASEKAALGALLKGAASQWVLRGTTEQLPEKCKNQRPTFRANHIIPYPGLFVDIFFILAADPCCLGSPGDPGIAAAAAYVLGALGSAAAEPGTRCVA